MHRQHYFYNMHAECNGPIIGDLKYDLRSRYLVIPRMERAPVVGDRTVRPERPAGQRGAAWDDLVRRNYWRYQSSASPIRPGPIPNKFVRDVLGVVHEVLGPQAVRTVRRAPIEFGWLVEWPHGSSTLSTCTRSAEDNEEVSTTRGCDMRTGHT